MLDELLNLGYKCFTLLINISENRKGNQEWTIQRHRRHWTWERERWQVKMNTTQKTKRMRMRNTIKLLMNPGILKG